MGPKVWSLPVCSIAASGMLMIYTTWNRPIWDSNCIALFKIVLSSAEMFFSKMFWKLLLISRFCFAVSIWVKCLQLVLCNWKWWNYTIFCLWVNSCRPWYICHDYLSSLSYLQVTVCLYCQNRDEPSTCTFAWPEMVHLCKLSSENSTPSHLALSSLQPISLIFQLYLFLMQQF
jgi:hypothetical protein